MILLFENIITSDVQKIIDCVKASLGYDILNYIQDQNNLIIQVSKINLKKNELLVGGKILKFTEYTYKVLLEDLEMKKVQKIKNYFKKLFGNNFLCVTINNKFEVYFSTQQTYELFIELTNIMCYKDQRIKFTYDKISKELPIIEKSNEPQKFNIPEVIKISTVSTEKSKELPIIEKKSTELQIFNIPEVIKNSTDLTEKQNDRKTKYSDLSSKPILPNKKLKHNHIKMIDIIDSIPREDMNYYNLNANKQIVSNSGLLEIILTNGNHKIKAIAIKWKIFYSYYKKNQDQEILDRTIREKFQPSKCKTNRRDPKSCSEWIEISLGNLSEYGVNNFYTSGYQNVFSNIKWWPDDCVKPVKKNKKVLIIPEPIYPTSLLQYNIAPNWFTISNDSAFFQTTNNNNIINNINNNNNNNNNN